MTDVLPVGVLHLVRDEEPDDVLSRTRDREWRNVAATLDHVDRSRFAEAAHRLAGTDRPTGEVLVLAGDAAQSIALILADRLAELRPRVRLLPGSVSRQAREVARAGCQDVLFLLDAEPYDPTVLDVARRAAAHRLQPVAVVDAAAAPLAAAVTLAFPVSSTGAAGFASLVGMLAFVNALVADVAARQCPSSSGRRPR
jgi:DNA-binding MurR/RpiR family transcriptional regulator